jgi:hypothetical protein
LGTGIYLAFRTPELRIHRWVEALGVAGPAEIARGRLSWMRPGLPEWVLYSLPDGLWAYAASSAVAVTRPSATRARSAWLGWLAVPPALAIGWELGQLVALLPGTFDPIDLLAYLLAGALAFLAHAPAPHAPQQPAARTPAWRPFAVMALFTLMLVGTSKAPVTSTGPDGGPIVPAIPAPPPPLSTADLPPPWDAIGLPSGATDIDAMRFVHRVGSMRSIEDDYVRTLTVAGWVVTQRGPAGGESVVMLSRGSDRLALRIRAEGTVVLVSISRLAQDADAGAPVDEALPDAGDDAGASAGDAGAAASFPAVVAAARPELKRCYQEALKKDPALAVNVDATVSVDATGRVSKVGLPPQPPRPPAFDACVLHTLTGLRFPALGHAQTVQIPLRFLAP